MALMGKRMCGREGFVARKHGISLLMALTFQQIPTWKEMPELHDEREGYKTALLRMYDKLT